MALWFIMFLVYPKSPIDIAMKYVAYIHWDDLQNYVHIDGPLEF